MILTPGQTVPVIDVHDTTSMSADGGFYDIVEEAPTYVISFPAPAPPADVPLGERGSGMSWVLAVLFLVFAAVCIRYRKNSRYFSLLIHDILEVRERHNAFDDTLRETSFIWLLNLLWCGAAGVLLYALLLSGGEPMVWNSVAVGRLCVAFGAAGAYTVFLTLAYGGVGWLFADSAQASAWVKGFLATQGFASIVMFPAALLALAVPSLVPAMVAVGIAAFLLSKLVFIYKGFCIFFANSASWVLFLYYLCSLEIVPVVLTYVATLYFSALIR